MHSPLLNRFPLFSVVSALGLAAMLHGSAAHAGTWQNNQAIGGFTTVNVYTPDTYSPRGDGSQRALLVVLHGCTQSISAFSGANLEAAAETWGMVIAVPDAVNKAGFGCWSYWEGARNRTSGDYQRLIALAQTLSGGAYSIDSRQVYLAGLSSGAAFANTTACIAPDIFAGVGVSAGPSIGTSSNGALGPCETADVATRCLAYATPTYASAFDTQVASIAQGDADSTVNQCYNAQNSTGMAAVYGVSPVGAPTTISDDATHTATEQLWEQGRVSKLVFHGLGHAWSGGAGASGSYIGNQSINYAHYLGGFFAANNRRVGPANAAPVVTNLILNAENGGIAISAVATDADGTIAQVRANVATLAGTPVTTFLLSAAGNLYQGTSAALADGTYRVDVTATDDEGATASATSTITLGPPPAPTAPELSDVDVVITGTCAAVFGTVFDVNGDLAGVSATFANGTTAATITGAAFDVERCGLSQGSQDVTLVAQDAAGLMTTLVVTFAIEGGVVGTLDQHIAAGRLDYPNYADCYLEYGADPFEVSEVVLANDRCQWQDDDGTCAGPEVDCTNAPADGGVVDGGTVDGGSDGGTVDGGSDGGSDGGTVDGGSDGGTVDSGSDGGTVDGGSDGGTVDSGSDGGADVDGGEGDSGGCSSTSTSTDHPPFGLVVLALGGVVFLRRRRPVRA